MTCHYPDLGTASDRLKIWFIHWSEALPRSGYWRIIELSMEFLRSFLRSHFARETIRGVAKCLLFSQESRFPLSFPRLSNAWLVTQAGAWRAKIKSGRRRLLINWIFLLQTSQSKKPVFLACIAIPSFVRHFAGKLEVAKGKCRLFSQAAIPKDAANFPVFPFRFLRLSIARPVTQASAWRTGQNDASGEGFYLLE